VARSPQCSGLRGTSAQRRAQTARSNGTSARPCRLCGSRDPAHGPLDTQFQAEFRLTSRFESPYRYQINPAFAAIYTYCVGFVPPKSSTRSQRLGPTKPLARFEVRVEAHNQRASIHEIIATGRAVTIAVKRDLTPDERAAQCAAAEDEAEFMDLD